MPAAVALYFMRDYSLFRRSACALAIPRPRVSLLGVLLGANVRVSGALQILGAGPQVTTCTRHLRPRILFTITNPLLTTMPLGN